MEGEGAICLATERGCQLSVGEHLRRYSLHRAPFGLAASSPIGAETRPCRLPTWASVSSIADSSSSVQRLTTACSSHRSTSRVRQSEPKASIGRGGRHWVAEGSLSRIGVCVVDGVEGRRLCRGSRQRKAERWSEKGGCSPLGQPLRLASSDSSLAHLHQRYSALEGQ